jgi:two-component sensor histidine kinase
VRGWRLAPGQGLAGWVVKHKQSLNVSDVQTDKRHFKGVDEKTGLKLHSILTVPLQVKEKVIGVMQLVDEEIGRFTSTHQTLLESLAATAAIAIQNAQWYEQARQDAETKLALLHEVNHRIKNNLTAIIGLLYAERHHAKAEGRTYQDILNNLINRVQGLATVHELLSASEWRSLPLIDLAWQVIHAALHVLSPSKQILIDVSPSPVRVSPTQANHLALVINELATNSMKYALPERDKVQISVSIALEENVIRFQFQDNGPGYPEEVLKSGHHHNNVGLYLVQTMVHSSLQGEVTFHNDHGAVTVIRFKMME